MKLTAEQIKGRIRNVAKANNADAIVLMRIFMMERFLERVSHSKYAENITYEEVVKSVREILSTI